MSDNFPDDYVEPPFHEPCGFCLQVLDERKAQEALLSRVAALEALLERCEIERRAWMHRNNLDNNDKLAAEIRTALQEKKCDS